MQSLQIPHDQFFTIKTTPGYSPLWVQGGLRMFLLLKNVQDTIQTQTASQKKTRRGLRPDNPPPTGRFDPKHSAQALIPYLPPFEARLAPQPPPKGQKARL